MHIPSIHAPIYEPMTRPTKNDPKPPAAVGMPSQPLNAGGNVSNAHLAQVYGPQHKKPSGQGRVVGEA